MMRGFWNEERWVLDGDALLMPNGRRLLLRDILRWQSDVIEGRHDLSGHWHGWRVRSQFLIAPAGTIKRRRIAEHAMRHLVQMHDFERLDVSRRQLTLF